MAKLLMRTMSECSFRGLLSTDRTEEYPYGTDCCNVLASREECGLFGNRNLIPASVHQRGSVQMVQCSVSGVQDR